MTATSSRTADILMHTVVTFLTPMFLATTGARDQARTAAIETVRACLTPNPMDLLLIGQMIALGLATLSSVSLSMAENIPISLILRLRGSAVSLHRASDQCRRALPEPVQQEAPLSDIDLAEEERIIAEVAETRKRVAEYQASFAQPQAAPNPPHTASLTAATPEPMAAPHGAMSPGEKIAYASWLYAMPGVPFPGFDDSADLPPAGTRTGNMPAAPLATTAGQVINGASPLPR
jgi:hypothetical protein